MTVRRLQLAAWILVLAPALAAQGGEPGPIRLRSTSTSEISPAGDVVMTDEYKASDDDWQRLKSRWPDAADLAPVLAPVQPHREYGAPARVRYDDARRVLEV